MTSSARSSSDCVMQMSNGAAVARLMTSSCAYASLQRQRKRKCRAAAQLTFHADGSAVKLDEFARDRKAESGTFDFFGERSDLAEFLEHRGLIFRRDTDAAIGDRDLRCAVVES